VKAVILAGGHGTRAKPFTDYFPKAMIPINGRPLIDYIANYISSFNFVDELIVVTDLKGLGGQIENYLGNKIRNKKISFIQDSQSGTAGDLIHISAKLKGTSEFLLWFVDNLCAIDLKKMLKQFRVKQSLACVGTRSERREETGFAVIKDGIITEFKEKPAIKLQMAECLGIYILGTDIIKKIRSHRNSNLNLSYDLLQDLSKKGMISAFDIGKKSWMDVETPALIERKKTLVKKIIKEME